MSYPLHLIATHEAGHAVVAAAFGFDVKATVNPGRALISVPNERWAQEPAIWAGLAGAAAESRLTGLPSWDHLSNEDWSSAVRRAATIPSYQAARRRGDVYPWFEEHMEIAEKFARRRWRLIEAVAGALEERGRLSHQEILRIVER